MANRFILNETSYFGAGSREVLGGEIARRGYTKAFIVADKDLIEFGVVAKVTDTLGDFPYEIFAGFKANPTVTNVKEGVLAYMASGADFIIAVGGGSAIDTAKAIGIIINNPEFSDVVSLAGKKENLSSKTVEVVFSAIDNTGSVSQVSDAFVETYSGSQLFVRTKFKDYDIIKVVAKISVGEESQELIAIVER